MTLTVEMTCATCGSADVSRDAWAEWDTRVQDWVVRAVFDEAYCHRCDARTTIVERLLEGGEVR